MTPLVDLLIKISGIFLRKSSHLLWYNCASPFTAATTVRPTPCALPLITRGETLIVPYQGIHLLGLSPMVAVLQHEGRHCWSTRSKWPYQSVWVLRMTCRTQILLANRNKNLANCPLGHSILTTNNIISRTGAWDSFENRRTWHHIKTRVGSAGKVMTCKMGKRGSINTPQCLTRCRQGEVHEDQVMDGNGCCKKNQRQPTSKGCKLPVSHLPCLFFLICIWCAHYDILRFHLLYCSDLSRSLQRKGVSRGSYTKKPSAMLLRASKGSISCESHARLGFWWLVSLSPYWGSPSRQTTTAW